MPAKNLGYKSFYKQIVFSQLVIKNCRHIRTVISFLKAFFSTIFWDFPGIFWDVEYLDFLRGF